MQDEIAAAITAALQVTLTAPSVPGRRYTPNLQAYEHYLKALYDSSRRTPDSMARAQKHFERAIDLDPQFAAAHAQLGNLFGQIGGYGVMPPAEALPLMREEARRALTVDPLLPDGHAMLVDRCGVVRFRLGGSRATFPVCNGAGSRHAVGTRNYAMYLSAADRTRPGSRRPLHARPQRGPPEPHGSSGTRRLPSIGLARSGGERRATAADRARRDVLLSGLHAGPATSPRMEDLEEARSVGRARLRSRAMVQTHGRASGGPAHTEWRNRPRRACCSANTCRRIGATSIRLARPYSIA